MIDLTKFKVGTLLKYSHKAKLGKKQKPMMDCIIVHVFHAYKVPKTKKVIKYYGKIIIDPKFGRVFGPMKNDRFVLKRGKNDYIIIHQDVRTFHYSNLEVIKY